MKRKWLLLIGWLGWAATPVQAQFTFTTNAGAITITGYAGMGGNIAIPGSINNLPVTAVGDYAFAHAGLTGVTFPGGLTSLGEAAFYDDALHDITIPASVTNLGEAVFYGNQLTNIFFAGNPPAAGSAVFLDNNNLTLYYLPTATGWGATFQGPRAVLWNPTIQTGDGRFGFQNNQFGFNIAGTSNILMVVQTSADLINPVWTPLQTLTLTNGLIYFRDPTPATGSMRFYRIISP